MIKIIFNLLTLLIGMSQAHSLNVTCSHDVFDDPDLPVCRILPENQSIHYENTSIQLYNTEQTIRGLIVEDMEMVYIPTGINKFIQKLLLLVIKNTGLRKVRKQNLENFNELLYLDLSYNQIEILENDLFSANKYLSAIILNSNKIRVVEENVFKSLHNLNLIDFRNNECYSGMTDKHQKIALFVNQIQTVCLNYNLKLWNHISNNNEKFENLTQENVKMRNEIDELSKQLSSNASSDITSTDSKQNDCTEKTIQLVLAVSIIIGVVVLIVLAIVIIFLNLEVLNHQKSEISNNKVQPYETVINFTKPNDYVASSVDISKENYYQELPNDDISPTIVINNAENNVKINETYSEVEAPTEPINEAAAFYAVVNKNTK